MKLIAYATQVGVTDTTASQWWRAGQLDTYRRPTGAALSARVSSADQQAAVLRQMQRRRAYAARG
jgi:predicted site-specific integrase-resolvase